MCAFLLGKREEVELLGRGVCICLRLVDAIKQLSNLMYQSIFPLTVNGSSSCCTLLPTLDIVFFHVHYSDEYTVAVHCSFKFHFFEDKWLRELLNSYWVAEHLIREVLVQDFFPPHSIRVPFLKNWFVKIFTVIYRLIFSEDFFSREKSDFSHFSSIVLFICWDAVRTGIQSTQIPCGFLWKDCKQEDKSVHMEGCLCNVISELFFILKTLRK